MILSASRRTDIPCFFADRFIEDIKAGRFTVQNPFNKNCSRSIPVSPETVECIVFWTKDPLNIMDKLPTLDALGYNYYFQFTVTPYGKNIEPGLRDKVDIEDTFILLSNIIGPNKVIWRYDPIIFSDLLSLEYHKREFERLCEKFYPYTGRVVISFVDMYAKLKNIFPPQLPEDIISLGKFIGSAAIKYGLTPMACCEPYDLEPLGIRKSSCIDKNLIENICGHSISISKDSNQRKNCGCLASVDIGEYGTCSNGCVYCYAR